MIDILWFAASLLFLLVFYFLIVFSEKYFKYDFPVCPVCTSLLLTGIVGGAFLGWIPSSLCMFFYGAFVYAMVSKLATGYKKGMQLALLESSPDAVILLSQARTVEKLLEKEHNNKKLPFYTNHNLWVTIGMLLAIIVLKLLGVF